MTTRKLSQASIHADEHSPLPAQGHTPGPWRDYHRKDGTAGVLSDGYGPIAEVHKGVSYTQGEIEANARLIASAPDLLAALKAADAFLNDTAEVRKILRFAITKAEGREQ